LGLYPDYYEHINKLYSPNFKRTPWRNYGKAVMIVCDSVVDIAVISQALLILHSTIVSVF